MRLSATGLIVCLQAAAVAADTSILSLRYDPRLAPTYRIHPHPLEAREGDFRQSGRIQMSTYRNGLEGARSRSFLNEGLHYQADLNYAARWSNGRTLWNFVFASRATSDTRVDRHVPPHLLNGLLQFQHAPSTWEGRFGEFTANFTPYSFLKSVQGLGLAVGRKTEFPGRFQAVAGRTEEAEDNRAFDEFAYGLRHERIFLGFDLGASYVKTDGERSSVLPGFQGSVKEEHGDLFSVDFKRRLWDGELEWEGEFATSRAEEDRTGAEPVLRGNAWWTRLTHRPAGRTEAFFFERVDPRFRTFSGFAARDLEQVRVSEDVRFHSNMRLTASYHWARDNLDLDKARRTVSRTPDVQYSWSPFPDAERDWMRTLGFQLGWNRRTTRSSDETVDNTATTYQGGVTGVFRGFRYYLSHQYRQTDNLSATNPQPRTIARTTTFNLSRNGDVWDRPYRWNARYSYQRVRTERGAGEYDRALNFHLDGSLDWTQEISLRGSVDLSDRDLQEVGANSARISYQAQMEYRFDPGRTFTLSYRVDFNRHDDRSQWFEERVIRGDLNVRF